ncbi:hypothetical protein ACJJTC_006185 [Scirpophaga incertulas]
MNNNVHNDIDNIINFDSLSCGVEDVRQISLPFSPSLTVLTQNIRSINRNFSELEILLARANLSCDVLILTKCWLSCTSIIPQMENFVSFSTTINRNQNEGVVVYVKTSLRYSFVELELHEANGLAIIFDNQTVIFAIYHSPSYNNISTFLNKLDEQLQKFSNFSNVILMGDINIAINPGKRNVDAERYLNVAAFNGLLPTHTKVTRDASNSCLDHVLVKTKKRCLTIVPQCYITDHKPVIFVLQNIQKHNDIARSINKIDKDGLSKEILNIDLKPIYDSRDPDYSMSYLIRNLSLAVDNNSHRVLLSRRNKMIKPWITPGILKCIRNRDKLHTDCRRNPNNEILKLTYTRYRNYLSKLLKKIKLKFEREEFAKAGKDNKKIWKVIKKITHTNKNKSLLNELLSIEKSPHDSLNTVNEYFINIGKVLANALHKESEHKKKTVPDNQMNSFVMYSTDIREVKSIIKGLKNNCSAECKNSVKNWIQKLNYNDTENFISVIS